MRARARARARCRQGRTRWTKGVMDARPTQTYSFLPASWAGDTHEETDVLSIGDREEKKSDF